MSEIAREQLLQSEENLPAIFGVRGAHSRAYGQIRYLEEEEFKIPPVFLGEYELFVDQIPPSLL